MATLGLLPVTSLQLPKQRSHAETPLITKGLRSHFRPKGVIIQLKRKEASFRPLCTQRSQEPIPEEDDQPSQFFPTSPLESIVHDFYSSLNDGKTDRLHELIAEDCVFEDLAFSKPFNAKEAQQFFKELTHAMGKDAKFIVDRVYEGKDTSMAVIWHLEWKKRRIPFAAGCSFFDCQETNDGALLIKNAKICEESPLKPGESVLELLKITIALFDKFPHHAEWILEKPHTLVDFMINAYKKFIEHSSFHF